MNNKFMTGTVLATAMLLTNHASAEQAPLQDQLLKCFEIAEEQNRTVCYDDIARSIAKANPEKQEAVKARAASDFGLAHQEQMNDEMVMKAAHVQKKAGGLWVVTMENGQVWEQIKEERFRFSSNTPDVRIFKMLLGGYSLQEHGKSKKIRVKRVK